MEHFRDKGQTLKTVSGLKLMLVEKANSLDWQRVRAIRLRALSEDPYAFGSTLEKELKYPDRFWFDRLNLKEWTNLLVSEGGEDLGIVTSGPYLDDLGIYSMWVDPIARGKGVGDALVLAIIRDAKKNNSNRIFLDVTDSNRSAINLYERHGFVPTGIRSALPAPRDNITEHQRVLELIK